MPARPHLTSTEACPEDSSSICCSLACRQAHNFAQQPGTPRGNPCLAGAAGAAGAAALHPLLSCHPSTTPLSLPPTPTHTHLDLFDLPLQVLHPQLPLANLVGHLLLLLAEPLCGGVCTPVRVLHCSDGWRRPEGGAGGGEAQGGEASANTSCDAQPSGRQMHSANGQAGSPKAMPAHSQSPSSSTASSPKPQETPPALPAPDSATCICTWDTCSSRSRRAASACGGGGRRSEAPQVSSSDDDDAACELCKAWY